MNEATLLAESLTFIKANLDTTFDAVPGYLRDFWMINSDSTLDDPTTTKQGSVFMYALITYKKSKNMMEFRLEPEKLFEPFDSWQMALSLAEINEKTDLRVPQIKLFQFDELSFEVERILETLTDIR